MIFFQKNILHMSAKEDGNPYDVDEDISVAYQSDPVQFMNQLGKIDPMYKDFYIRTLVSVAYNEFDWEGFKSQILSLSVEDSSVINQLYAYAIQFEEEEHAWEEYYKVGKTVRRRREDSILILFLKQLQAMQKRILLIWNIAII